MGILSAHAVKEYRRTRVRRHLLFWARSLRVLKLRSTLWKRTYQERWMIVRNLHTFLSVWIFFVVFGSSDENIVMIKVRTKRDKGPKKWSLAFDLPKFKMFTRKDKFCRLVSRCWSFIVLIHGVVCCHDRQIHHPFLDGNFEFELILRQLWTEFSS